MSTLLAASLALSACVSLGADVDPPDALLTLSPTATAPAGSGAVTGSEGSAGAIAVLTPEVPAKLDLVRIPVQVSDTEIAYLQDAVWIEKPARLFRRLLGETLRTRSGDEGAVLVLDSDDTPTLASQSVRGTLLDMGYDALSGDVVVRFEAIRTSGEGVVTSRRFEARESVIEGEAEFVGPALNSVANRVAGEIADWMIGGE
ncbi:MAG: ABC-type transport auxiliary lipoprotein family protein [Pseudomonadota bacterium]